MAYLDIAHMTSSGPLTQRMSAAAAQEQHAGAALDPPDPECWVGANRYALCSSPGWDAAWASAGAAGNLDPGSDPGVITDGMILSAVQAVLAG